MDFTNFFSSNFLYDAALIAIPALLCITIHELAHGYIAYRLGDNTAKDMGRLTLNPIKHIDPIGLMMILFAGFGWAKPVPVNMNNFKNVRLGMAVTSFAGPASNIILATIVLFIFFLLPYPYGGINALLDNNLVAGIIFRTALLSVTLAVFNMLPIPPLDGSKIFFSLFSQDFYYKLLRYERYGMILVILLVLSGRVLNFSIFEIIVIRPAWFLVDTISTFIEAVIGLFK